MRFQNRFHAGAMLVEKLKAYKGKDVIVFALPRGGVQTAIEIARYLQAPLGLVITRKISHPSSPEYAIAAISETGKIVGNPQEMAHVDEEWLEEEIQRERDEILRRKKVFLTGRKSYSGKGKIVILVDDGVATGLTLQAGIQELKSQNPAKLIVAVPIIPSSTAKKIKPEVDLLISLHVPTRASFLEAVGSYYDDFSQVSDREVTVLLEGHDQWLRAKKLQNNFNIRTGENGLYGYDEP